VKLHVRHAGGELTIGSQKEFLLLWRSGIIAPDDLVRPGGQEGWVPAAELPWISNMTRSARRDGRRLLWLTIALLLLALAGSLFIQLRFG
jgi:hypothetical protein